MTIPTYPILTSCDPDIDSWIEVPAADATLRSGQMSGLVTTRARYTRVPKTWAFSYQMLNDVDKQLLELFERNTSFYGAVIFYWQSFQEAYGVNAWTKETSYTLGRIVHPVIPTGRSYKCIVAGQTHLTTEPVWPTTENATVNDGDVTWKENTYRVRFSAPIKFGVSNRIDLWRVDISLQEA